MRVNRKASPERDGTIVAQHGSAGSFPQRRLISFGLSPVGTSEYSPALQRWDKSRAHRFHSAEGAFAAQQSCNRLLRGSRLRQIDLVLNSLMLYERLQLFPSNDFVGRRLWI